MIRNYVIVDLFITAGVWLVKLVM